MKQDTRDIVGEIENAIQNRKQTYNSIYHDIGVALDDFTTEELTVFYIKKYGESSIRYFLEQQIISGEVNKIKYA